MATALRAPAPEPVLPDDAALVERLRRGDPASLGGLYDRHAPALLGVAIRILGVEREAQDLVHDVFLEAWEHAREYDGARGTVRTWLLVRLRSRALDRLGRAERARACSFDELARADGVPGGFPDAAAADRVAVRQALARIEPGVRDVLELTYFRGLTAREIAGRLRIPTGTVKSRLARGLVALARLFDAEGKDAHGD